MNYPIVAGPSEDLLFRSLRDGDHDMRRPVIFTLKDSQGVRREVECAVNKIERSPGDKEQDEGIFQIFILGHSVDGKTGDAWHFLGEGHYSGRTRTGSLGINGGRAVMELFRR